jgi:hypothetical protein
MKPIGITTPMAICPLEERPPPKAQKIEGCSWAEEFVMMKMLGSTKSRVKLGGLESVEEHSDC